MDVSHVEATKKVRVNLVPTTPLAEARGIELAIIVANSREDKEIEYYSKDELTNSTYRAIHPLVYDSKNIRIVTKLIAVLAEERGEMLHVTKPTDIVYLTENIIGSYLFFRQEDQNGIISEATKKGAYLFMVERLLDDYFKGMEPTEDDGFVIKHNPDRSISVDLPNRSGRIARQFLSYINSLV